MIVLWVAQHVALGLENKAGGEDPNKDPLLVPLNLTAEEKSDLLAFLESLNGDEIIIEPPTSPAYGVIQTGRR